MSIERISQRLTLRLSKYTAYDPQLSHVYAYGVFMILSTIFLLLIALVVGILSQSLLDIFLFLLFFIPLRLTSGGYHSQSLLKCTVIYIISLASVVTLTQIMIRTYILPFILLTSIFSILITFLFAPVSHPNAPIRDTDWDKYRLLSRIICVSDIFMILILYSVLHTNAWSATLLIGICLGPLYASVFTLLGALVRRKEEI